MEDKERQGQQARMDEFEHKLNLLMEEYEVEAHEESDYYGGTYCYFQFKKNVHSYDSPTVYFSSLT